MVFACRLQILNVFLSEAVPFKIKPVEIVGLVQKQQLANTKTAIA